MVVGVLKYEDTVAEEIEDASDELLQIKGSNEQQVTGYQDDIAELRMTITHLETANKGLDAAREDLARLNQLFA